MAEGRWSRLLRPNLLLWAGAGVFALNVLWDLWSSYRDAEERARALATSYVRLVEQHASSTFDRVDMILTEATALVAAEQVPDAASLTEARRRALQEHLIALQRKGVGIVAMSATDADGTVFANTVGAPPGMSLADRGYFRQLKAGVMAQPAISEAVKGRVSNMWGVQVARSVEGPGGGFAGMVVANIGLNENFIAFYRTLSFSPNGVISLRDADNRILVRYPDAAEYYGRKLNPQFVSASRATEEGGYVGPSTIDGLIRLTVFRKLRSYPIYANFNIDRDYYLAGWYGGARKSAVLLVLIGLGATVATRTLRRKDQLDQALRLSEEHRRAAERLDFERQIKAADLERTRTLTLEAEAASRSKSQFLANMSHELRTPLNAIIGFSQVMRQELFGPLGHDKYREYMGDIGHSAEHLLDLINDILDVSAIEAGKLALDLAPVEVGTLMLACLRMIGARAEVGDIHLINRVGALPAVLADERRLKQVLLNIVANAVKFTRPGGTVTLTGLAEEDGVTITIADTGIGMDQAGLAKALQPFGQIENPLQKSHEGTGLGLPLSVRLMELHGGRLSIASASGVGTTVTLRIPRGGALTPGSASP